MKGEGGAMTGLEFSTQVLGTFSFLIVVGLAAQIVHVWTRTGTSPIKEWLAPLGGFLYPALMFAWAMAPDRFGPALPALDSWPARLGGLALMCLGTAVMGVAMHTMAGAWRMGTDPSQRSSLVREGIYGRIRHPIYTGFMAVLAGVWMVSGGIFFAAVGAGYAAVLIWKARSEERHMTGVFGDAYREHMRTTGRFLPWF